MNNFILAQDTVDTGNPILNITIFACFIAVTMTIVVRTTRTTSQKGSDFYTGGGSFAGWQNGLAISGDWENVNTEPRAAATPLMDTSAVIVDGRGSARAAATLACSQAV